MTNLPWDCFSTPPQDNQQFFDSVKDCLPTIYNQVSNRGSEPILMLVAFEQEKWRALLAVLYENLNEIYFSPETLTYHEPRIGYTRYDKVYLAPVINGRQMKTGIYVLELETLVYGLCLLKGVPSIFIDYLNGEVKDEIKNRTGMLPVAVFGPKNMVVMSVSRMNNLRQESASREHLIQQGFVACELAQYAKARTCYTKVVDLYPSDSLVWYNLGVVEYRAGNFEAAADAFTRVIELKEHLTTGAYGQALCLKKLGRPFKLPPGYSGEPELFNVEAPMHNLAHELHNRGYDATIEVQPKYTLCRVNVRVGSIKYKLSLQPFVVGVVEGFWREEGGQEIDMSNSSMYPNPTENDKEFLTFKGKLAGWLRLYQMPVSPRAMAADEYTELSKTADLKAITRDVGPHGWTRIGQTYEEAEAERAARLGPNVQVTSYFNFADLVEKNEVGTFTACAFNGKPHLIAKIAVPASDIQVLRSSIVTGRIVIVLRTSCYIYPTYPIVYNRIFITTGSGPQPGIAEGILVEAATDFTNANFQEWVITLQRTHHLSIHIYNDTGEHLGDYEKQVEPQIVNMVVEAVDKANAALKAIPVEQRKFTAQPFFKDHPEPFLFD